MKRYLSQIGSKCLVDCAGESSMRMWMKCGPGASRARRTSRSKASSSVGALAFVMPQPCATNARSHCRPAAVICPPVNCHWPLSQTMIVRFSGASRPTVASPPRFIEHRTFAFEHDHRALRPRQRQPQPNGYAHPHATHHVEAVGAVAAGVQVETRVADTSHDQRVVSHRHDALCQRESAQLGCLSCHVHRPSHPTVGS